jgi:Rho termination factor, N-terminal domain
MRGWLVDTEQVDRPAHEAECSANKLCCAIALCNATEVALIPEKVSGPITVISVSKIQPKTLPGHQPIALLPEAKQPITTRSIESVSRLSMGIRELRAMAKERKIKGYSKMSKTTLLSLAS